MEKFSNFAIALYEQSLLRYYYKYASEHKNIIYSDKQADIFKTETELYKKEYRKRYIDVAKKVCDCVKSSSINKYFIESRWSTGSDLLALVFDLEKYFKDNNIDSDIYTAIIKNEIVVTTIKKLFRTIKKESEKKSLEFAFSQASIELAKILSKPYEYLEYAGITEYLDARSLWEIHIGGVRFNSYFSEKISDVDDLNYEEEKVKLDLDINEDGELCIDNEWIVKESNGKCIILTDKKKATNTCLKAALVDGYFLNEEQLIEALEKTCNINVITIDEIEESLESCASQEEYNAWLDNRLKKVVLSSKRPIEEVDLKSIDIYEDADDNDE